MEQLPLHFTGILTKDEDKYVGLCLELDVSSYGVNKPQAKRSLEEAVILYLESAIESNLPYIRPVPTNEVPEHILEKFPIHADLKIYARAA